MGIRIIDITLDSLVRVVKNATDRADKETNSVDRPTHKWRDAMEDGLVEAVASDKEIWDKVIITANDND
jgi:hypothetical protein